jgi:hypothetical protein
MDGKRSKDTLHNIFEEWVTFLLLGEESSFLLSVSLGDVLSAKTSQ